MPDSPFQKYLDELSGGPPDQPEPDEPTYQNYLNELEGVGTDPPPPPGPSEVAAQQQRASMTAPAFGADPYEVSQLPQLKLDVYPSNWNALISSHETRGRSFGALRKDENLRKASIQVAEGYALDILKHRGLIDSAGRYAPGLTKETVGSLVGALRYNLVGMYAPLSDEEEPTVVAAGGKALMDYIQAKGLDQLKGLNPQSDEAVQLQQLVAKAKQYGSLIENKDPAVLRAVRDSVLVSQKRMRKRRTAPEEALFELPWGAYPGSPVDHTALKIADAARTAAEFNSGLPEKVKRRERFADYHRLQAFLDESLSQLDTPEGAQRAMDSSFRGALEAVRAEGLGFSPEVAATFGVEALMFQSHPAVALELAEVQAMQKLPGDKAPGDPSKLEEKYRKSAQFFVQQLNAIDQNAAAGLQGLDIAPDSPLTSTAIANGLERLKTTVGEVIGEEYETATPALAVLGHWLNEVKDFADANPGLGIDPKDITARSYFERELAPARVEVAARKLQRAELQAMKELDGEGSTATPELLNQEPWAVDRSSEIVTPSHVQALVNPEGDVFQAMMTDLAPESSRTAAETAALFPHGTVGERLYADAMGQAFDEGAWGDQALFSQKGKKMIANVLAGSQRRWLNGEGPWYDYARDAFAFWAVSAGTNARETAKTLFTHPKDFARMWQVGQLIGIPAGLAISEARNAIVGSLLRKVKHRRLARLITVAQHNDPDVIPLAQDVLNSRFSGQAVGRQARALDAVGIQLETNERLARQPLMGGDVVAKRVRDRTRGARTLQRELRHIDDSTLEELATGMGLGEEVAQYVENVSLRSLISESAAILKQDAMKLDKFSADGILHNSAQTVAQQIVADLDANVGLPETAREAGLSVPAHGPGGTYTAVARFYAEARKAVVERRAATAEVRVRQNDLLEFTRTAHAQEAAGLRGLIDQGVIEDPEILASLQERLDFHDKTASRIGQHIADLEKAPWHQDINFSRVDFLTDEQALPLDYLATHMEMHGDSMGIEGLYTRLSRPKETFRQFEERWTRAMRGDVSDKDRRLLRRGILRNYYNTRGLEPQLYDGLTGQALSSSQAALLQRRRKMLARVGERLEAEGADAPDSLVREAERMAQLIQDDPLVGDVFGTIDSVEIQGAFRQMQRIADADTAAVAAGIWVGRNGVDDGLPSSAVNRLRDQIVSLRASRVAQRKQLGRISAALNRSPELRRAYRASLEEAKLQGRPVTLEELRAAAPEAASHLPITEEENLKYLLNFDTEFRGTLLDDLVKMGRFTRAEADEFAKPFMPVRYFTRDGRVVPRKATVEEESFVGVSGTSDQGLFEVQRDPTAWRVIVHRENVGNNTRAFETRAAAEEWLDRQYGMRGELKKDTGRLGPDDLTVKTGARQQADLIAPMGEDKHLRLIPETPERALVERWHDLLDESHQYAYLRSLDRPGWAFGSVNGKPEAVRAQLEKLFPDPKARSEYTILPVSKKLGPLSGKAVHKSVKKDIDTYTYHFEHISSFAKELGRVSKQQDLFSRLALGVVEGFGRLGSAMKDLIITNPIARSGIAQATNLAADFSLFAHSATGGSIFGGAGRHRIREAVALLREDFSRADIRVSDDLRTALEHGGLDEGLMGTGLDESIQRDMIEMSFGRVPWAKHMSNEAKLFARGLTQGKAGSLEDAYLRSVGAKTDDPQLEAMFERWQSLDDTYRKILDGKIENFSRDETSAVLAAKEELEAKIREAEPTMMNSVLRGARTLQHVIMGRRGGRFREREIFSRRVYGQASNVSRLATFLHLWKDKGMSPAEAGATVNRFMQTFSRTPPAVRTMSRRGVLNPVAGFLYESGRIAANNLTHNTPFALAMATALPAVNFTTMALSGTNPYAVLSAMDANDRLPAPMQYMSSAFVPSGDGSTVYSLTLPGGNILMPTKAPVGPAASMVMGGGWDNGTEPSLLDSYVKSPLLHFFNGTALNLSIAALTGQDFETGGHFNESYGDWLGGAVSSVADIMMPPETPFWGARARRVQESLERPPRTNVDDEKAVWEALGDSVGIRTRKLGFEDRLAITIRKAKARSPGMRAAMGEPLWQELRAAGFAQRKHPSPENLAEVNRLTDALLEKSKENRLLHQWAGGDIPSEAKREKLIARMLDSFDWKAGLADLDLPTTLDVLLEVQPQLTKNTKRQWHQMIEIATRRGDWLERERSFSSADQLEAAIRALDAYLPTAKSPTGLKELQYFRAVLLSNFGAALRGELQSQFTDPKRIEARAFLEGE